MRRLLAVVVVFGCGATPAQETVPAEPVKAETVAADPVTATPDSGVPVKMEPVAGDGFEAIVRFDEEPGKEFQGVWLERADGARWVVADRPEAWLRSFAGRTVRVTGAAYKPTEYALRPSHYRIASLTVVETKGSRGPLLAVGPEQTTSGKFVEEAGKAGRKSEGSTLTYFVADNGVRYRIEGHPEGPLELGVPVKIDVRLVVPDWSFRAPSGEMFLWILKIQKS